MIGILLESLRILVAIFIIVFLLYLLGIFMGYVKLFSYWATCQITGSTYSREAFVKSLENAAERKQKKKNRKEKRKRLRRGITHSED